MSWPPFSSVLVFELFEREGEDYVRVSYNKRILDLGSWGEFCPFELFVESVEDTIPDDFERECAELPEEERTDLTQHSDEDMEAAQRRNHRPRGGNVME